ncbi:MAG: PPC domain-containing protein [Phycisphaerae bacterium]
MTTSWRLLLAALTVWAATARGQSNQKEPHIGYLYPAGGQQGKVVLITVGGQNLRGGSDVYVSGTGVKGTVVQYYRPLNVIRPEQREALQKKMRELIQKRIAELPGGGYDFTSLRREFGIAKPNAVGPAAARRQDAPARKSLPGKNQASPQAKQVNQAKTAATQPAELPEHPLLYDLEKKSLRELLHVGRELLNLRNRQPNAQIAESVLIRVAIEPNAKPGDREIRIGTPLGLTNPMCFQVDQLAEISELEPNDPHAPSLLPDEPPVTLPVIINGQVKPGDVDRFRFRARRGQKLVIETWARHLVPYLADAVPGWFQATLALYDAKGKEVAFADDYRFDPDPVLMYEVPDDGVYTVEIRDSIYRGREDFVYRIALAERPFITQVFPLGGRMGTRAAALIDGWNLPVKQLFLATAGSTDGIRQSALRRKDHRSNEVSYAVDTLPESVEVEPNDTLQKAQLIELPRILNGTITQAGDVDVFQFTGKAGTEIVAEVRARRLGSPLDSLLRLSDASGRVLEWNDDHEDKESGLLTHHADSYLRTRLPQDGAYYVHLADSQQHGGKPYAYRLRVGAPRPDFALRLTPSSINMPVGGSALVTAHVIRKDGFDGEIELVLKDGPAGFALSGARIPSGRDQVRMTITAPHVPLEKPLTLHLEGRAEVGGRILTRPVVPAEDMMQAFSYRHLTPSRELMVTTIGGRRGGPPLEVVNEGPVRIPAGGTAEVLIRAPAYRMQRELKFELREPPRGVTLAGVTGTPQGHTLAFRADASAAQVGFADNLIVEVFTEAPARGQSPGGQKKTRASLGVLPAIPIEISQR